MSTPLDTLRDLATRIRMSAGSDPSFEENRRLKTAWADALDALLAAEAQPHGGMWQPIETAPKNRRVLIAAGKRVQEGYWSTSDECWLWFGPDDPDIIACPSGWMPLPAPLERGAQQG